MSAAERGGAYGAYKVGDRVCVTGTIAGVNNSDADWIIVHAAHGTAFAVERASTNPDLAVAAQQPQPAPEVLAVKLMDEIGWDDSTKAAWLLEQGLDAL